MSRNSYKYCVLVLILVTSVSIASAQSESVAIKPSKSLLTKAELEMWNNPEFKRQFTLSYMAETEIEPKITLEEREQMLKVLDLISSEKMDEAADLLRQHRKPDKDESKPRDIFSLFTKKREKPEIKAAEEDAGGVESSASAVFDFTLGNIYFQQEKYEEAARMYEVAVIKFPKFRRVWKNLGLIYVRSGAFDKAISALTRVLELGGSDSVTFGLLGFSHSSQGNYLSAESAYRMAILLDAKTLDWQMGLVRCFFKQSRYAEAVALCGQLIEVQPDRADLLLLQANGFIGMNQPLKAAEIFELINQMGKATPASLNMLGDIYINEELYAIAVNSYIAAMDKNPEGSVERPLRAAKILVARGALAETRKIIKKIETDRGKKLDTVTKKDLLKLRARLAVADGSGEEEVKVLEEIVELDPLDGEALILLGQHSRTAGDTEKAVFYYERAASMEKFEAVAKIRHAELLVGIGKYAEALPLLRRAQALDPRDNVQQYLEQIERVAKTR